MGCAFRFAPQLPSTPADAWHDAVDHDAVAILDDALEHLS